MKKRELIAELYSTREAAKRALAERDMYRDKYLQSERRLQTVIAIVNEDIPALVSSVSAVANMTGVSPGPSPKTL